MDTDPSFQIIADFLFQTDPDPAFYSIAEPIRILIFSLLRTSHFKTDPNPAFYSFVDPAFQNSADLSGSRSATLTPATRFFFSILVMKHFCPTSIE
jgi:hypothetical protein